MERICRWGRTAIFIDRSEFAMLSATYAALATLIVLSPLVLSGWTSMLVNCCAVFLGLKHGVWFASAAATQRVATTERAAFFLLWPGMDVAAFLDAQRTDNPKSTSRDWASAILKTAIAAIGLWIVVPMLAPFPDAAVGIAGMLAAILLVHCGLFHLLALAWRANGRLVQRIMNAPLAASSLADFWSRRWNLAFRDAAAILVFRPTARRWGTESAAFATFLFSGIVHEAAISLPARGGYGLPTIYFLLQYAGLAVERRWLRGDGWGKRLAARAFAVVVVVAPLPLLFHPPFAEQVIVPLLKALGILS